MYLSHHGPYPKTIHNIKVSNGGNIIWVGYGEKNFGNYAP